MTDARLIHPPLPVRHARYVGTDLRGELRLRKAGLTASLADAGTEWCRCHMATMPRQFLLVKPLVFFLSRDMVASLSLSPNGKQGRPSGSSRLR